MSTRRASGLGTSSPLNSGLPSSRQSGRRTPVINDMTSVSDKNNFNEENAVSDKNRAPGKNGGHNEKTVVGQKAGSNTRPSRPSSLANLINEDTSDENVEMEDESDEFLRVNSMPLRARVRGQSRVSRSSLSTTTDSRYSTPGTSATATPLVTVKGPGRPRGRPRNVEPVENVGRDQRELPAGRLESISSFSVVVPGPRRRPEKTAALTPAAIQALELARNLRESEFSLNPRNASKRRKYAPDSDEDEFGSDETPDAQLARALQEEEELKLLSEESVSEEYTPKRSLRASKALRQILPKTDDIDSLSELEQRSISGDHGQFLKGKHTKVTASVSAVSKKRKYEAGDSEESEFVDSDSDDGDYEADYEGVHRFPDSGSDFPVLTAGGRALIHFSDSDVPLTIRAANRNGVLPFKRNRSSVSVRSRGTARRGGLRGRERHTRPEEREIGDSDSSDSTDDSSGLGNFQSMKLKRRAEKDRARLEAQHPDLLTMWDDLENMPKIKSIKAAQPKNISRELKPFQLEGLNWMKEMEKTDWGGGLLGDEMGMGKTIQAVSLIMSDYPAKNPSLVLIPPVALMQWQQEIGDYTDGTLKTFVFHGTNKDTKGMTTKMLLKYDVILMSYNSLESMFRHQEKGFKRKDSVHKQDSVIHKIKFHRVILDEAHNIKTRTTGVAKACFALKADHKWCLSGTPLQNRIGEFFSLVRFLEIRPFACYFCKQCPCNTLEWTMNSDNRCTSCDHAGMQHVSVFNQELLNPIQKFGNKGLGKEAFAKLRLLTDRFMLRRIKRDHSSAMELPAKEIHVERQFFSEVENDFAGSIMNNNVRKFDTYVAEGVLLNNYANIFGLIMQMRQVADHPDLILKKNSEGGQNILVCCICDDPAEDAIRSNCRHDFCRACVKNFIASADQTGMQPDCPQCHIPLSIDLEQAEREQDEQLVKKSSIINRIKMEKWTSSTKIESLVYQLHNLRSHKHSTKSIIFSQFTTMLQLIEWRLRRAGITSVMLDGSMTPAQRQASINHFMTNADCECFLVSLKAGGVALNLTEASHVFIVDPWWNPAAEWQSADRCHRIGQARPCTITRLCIEDSVESRMVLLQEKKANMINSTINSDEAAMESLTPEDMQFLFRGT